MGSQIRVRNRNIKSVSDHESESETGTSNLTRITNPSQKPEYQMRDECPRVGGDHGAAPVGMRRGDRRCVLVLTRRPASDCLDPCAARTACACRTSAVCKHLCSVTLAGVSAAPAPFRMLAALHRKPQRLRRHRRQAKSLAQRRQSLVKRCTKLSTAEMDEISRGAQGVSLPLSLCRSLSLSVAPCLSVLVSVSLSLCLSVSLSLPSSLPPSLPLSASFSCRSSHRFGAMHKACRRPTSNRGILCKPSLPRVRISSTIVRGRPWATFRVGILCRPSLPSLALL